MNKSKWFLLIVLSFIGIFLGLVMGYYNANDAAIIEQQRSNNSMREESSIVPPILSKQAESVNLITAQSTSTANDLDTNAYYQEGDQNPLDSFAVESMTDARLNGDDRAPPIVHGSQGESATADEIESPELYLEYESRQERKIYKAYVEAADIKIEVLEEQIAIAKERGMAEEMLEVGIEKVRRIKEMKAQLLSDNPDLFIEN